MTGQRLESPDLTLRTASEADLDRIERVLDAAGLPSRDVRRKRESFVLAYAGGEWIGLGGVETFGPDGLLRSVVVTEPNRGRGYGTALCEALADRARSNGRETLYLLTTSASGFFRRLGYEEIDRETVPASVRGTAEFTDLCPGSATCMRRDLR